MSFVRTTLFVYLFSIFLMIASILAKAYLRGWTLLTWSLDRRIQA